MTQHLITLLLPCRNTTTRDREPKAKGQRGPYGAGLRTRLFRQSLLRTTPPAEHIWRVQPGVPQEIFRRADMHEWPAASFSSAHLLMQPQVLRTTIDERETREEGYASTHRDTLTTTADVLGMDDR